MKIELYKVTWYSKLFAVVLFVGTFYLGFYLGMEKQSAMDTYQSINKELSKASEYVPFSIETKQEKNENYTAEYPVFKGSDAIVSLGNNWIKSVLKDFADEANADVPKLRADFGADSPVANYNITIKGTKESSKKTDTVVLSMYTYTGGANGTEIYNTMTTDKSGKLLMINDVIKPEKQAEFIEMVKNAVSKYGEGELGMIFPEAVAGISIETLQKWAFTEDGMKIYFDKYEVAPGAAGALSILLPKDQIADFVR